MGDTTGATAGLVVRCPCGWTAGRGFAVADGWDLSRAEPMCSLCIFESEGRGDPDAQGES